MILFNDLSSFHLSKWQLERVARVQLLAAVDEHEPLRPNRRINTVHFRYNFLPVITMQFANMKLLATI